MNIESGSDFVPDGHQALTWINADLLLTKPKVTISADSNQNTNIFFYEDGLKNVVCKMSSILSKPHSI